MPRLRKPNGDEQDPKTMELRVRFPDEGEVMEHPNHAVSFSLGDVRHGTVGYVRGRTSGPRGKTGR